MEQEWKGMDGAIAFHMIDRHAEDWAHAGKMMREWREANESDELEQLRQRVAELEKEQVAWKKFTERANNTVSAAEAERDALKSKIDRVKYIMASNAYKDGATLSVEICVLDDEAVGDFSERICWFVDRAME